MKLFENRIPRPENSHMNSPEILNSKEKLPEPVYYIESPSDSTVLVGMDVTISHETINGQNTSIVSWHDTIKERIMTASEIQKKDSIFAFKRAEHEGGGVYYFTPMNLEIYNGKVKQRLMDGSDFDNNEDLIKGFLATMEDSY